MLTVRRVYGSTPQHTTPARSAVINKRNAPLLQTLIREPVISAPSRQVLRHGLFGLGIPEIAVIAGVAALIFGPSKLPELGKAAGQTAKSFQDAAKEFNEELKKGLEEDKAGTVEEKPATKDATATSSETKPAASEAKPAASEAKKDA